MSRRGFIIRVLRFWMGGGKSFSLLSFPSSFPLLFWWFCCGLILMRVVSNVTHYSYFGAFRSDVSNVGPNAAMLTQDGKLTDIGAWYLAETATGAIPKGAAGRLSIPAGWLLLLFATGAWSLL